MALPDWPHPAAFVAAGRRLLGLGALAALTGSRPRSSP